MIDRDEFCRLRQAKGQKWNNIKALNIKRKGIPNEYEKIQDNW